MSGRRGLGMLMATSSAAALVASACRVRRQRCTSAAVGPVELAAFRRFNDTSETIASPAWVVMQAGSLAAVFVTAGALAKGGRGRDAAVATAAGLGVWVGVKAIKPAVGRGRPSDHVDDVAVRGLRQTGLGYPSGHAAVAMTLATIVSRRWCGPARAGAIVVAGLAGGARMYVGAHLPLDVVGGLAIGALVGQGASAVIGNDTVARG